MLVVSVPQPRHYAFATNGDLGAFLIFRGRLGPPGVSARSDTGVPGPDPQMKGLPSMHPSYHTFIRDSGNSDAARTFTSMSSPSTPESTQTKKTGRSNVQLILVLAIIAVAALSGIVVLHHVGTVNYACLSISSQNGAVDVSTSGIIHYTGTQYYVSCEEGAPLPTSADSYSCLTVKPDLVTSTYPGAASTYYYYLSTTTGKISLQGASANSTEIITPASASFVITCS